MKQLKSVPDVVDVSSFGGITREYQVQVDPTRLVEYGLNIGQADGEARRELNAAQSLIDQIEKEARESLESSRRTATVRRRSIPRAHRPPGTHVHTTMLPPHQPP